MPSPKQGAFDADLANAITGVNQAFTKLSNGVTTLLAPSSLERVVIFSVTVTEVFANGDGAQPTFTLGETGDATKFAAAARFTNAAANADFSFGGVLAAGKALIVTATTGTGTTETGALRVVGHVLPS